MSYETDAVAPSRDESFPFLSRVPRSVFPARRWLVRYGID